MATERKFDNKDLVEFEAKATVAITGNPTAPGIGGGLFAKFDTDPNYFVVCGAGDAPDGVVDSNVLINGSALIKAYGVRPIRLGGTVAKKGFVQPTTGGKAVAWDGYSPCGGQVTKSGVDGDFVPLIVGKQPSAGQGTLPAKGAAVASATTIVPTGACFHVTGNTDITAITTTGLFAGQRLVLIFDSNPNITLTHMVGGTMAATASDVLELVFDGSALYEVGRSANA